MAEPWRVALERAQSTAPNPSTLHSVIESLMPGAGIAAVHPLIGGIGAVMHRIDLDSASGERRSIVLRQLMPEWGEGPDDLRRQVATHAFLSEEGLVPVPGVLWNDASGDAFGRPAFLMQFVDGRPIVGDLADPLAVDALASTLSDIHALRRLPTHLESARTERAHLEAFGVNRSHSELVDADALRAALRDHVTDEETGVALIHRDYHGGNVLWGGAKVTAVLDWPLAAIGSPHYDEAYAHADTWLAWGDETARRFRDRYRAFSGSDLDVDRQRFWDLTAVVRFLPSPDSMGLVDAYRATGCVDITSEQLDTRYVELAERLLA